MLIFPLAVALLLSSAPREIFLGANGDDLNPGTAEKPVATLNVAKEQARAAQCQPSPSEVGDYVLWKPVIFNPRDKRLAIRAANPASSAADFHFASICRKYLRAI